MLSDQQCPACGHRTLEMEGRFARCQHVFIENVPAGKVDSDGYRGPIHRKTACNWSGFLEGNVRAYLTSLDFVVDFRYAQLFRHTRLRPLAHRGATS